VLEQTINKKMIKIDLNSKSFCTGERSKENDDGVSRPLLCWATAASRFELARCSKFVSYRSC